MNSNRKFSPGNGYKMHVKKLFVSKRVHKSTPKGTLRQLINHPNNTQHKTQPRQAKVQTNFVAIRLEPPNKSAKQKPLRATRCERDGQLTNRITKTKLAVVHRLSKLRRKKNSSFQVGQHDDSSLKTAEKYNTTDFVQLFSLFFCATLFEFEEDLDKPLEKQSEQAVDGSFVVLLPLINCSVLFGTFGVDV
jgi:hypothetical protein